MLSDRERVRVSFAMQVTIVASVSVLGEGVEGLFGGGRFWEEGEVVPVAAEEALPVDEGREVVGEGDGEGDAFPLFRVGCAAAAFGDFAASPAAAAFFEGAGVYSGGAYMMRCCWIWPSWIWFTAWSVTVCWLP
jgi:hypothetical protein